MICIPIFNKIKCKFDGKKHVENLCEYMKKILSTTKKTFFFHAVWEGINTQLKQDRISKNLCLLR